MTIEIDIPSLSDTERLAATVGAQLQGGECFEFVSDLGGGKTTFIRALVAGAGSQDAVSSPTFTIGKQYSSDKLRFYHFDFYRLQEPGLVAEELSEAVQDPSAVLLIEWAQTVNHVLPEDRVVIRLERQPDNEDARRCTITFPETRSYLFTEYAA